ncbi:putative fimbrial assembly protein PilM [Vibrio ichthyoenteri ATCC 700023]|uniref:Putative fimbrial assembly protein PilM n=1 Tax=Vibrio ichthyoenteri ATCC 700023 TaxID=870968 RepID=F9S8J3_9VIBR|nr:type IV pilus assembly protein PilM [Vibrio ichthyoenteri]EGU29669.1 putative fimbrial assembly protein PilM [Vibrio ichthyoenteri ATCC 700023]
MSFSFITGIDIGHYSIKAVVLKPVKGTLTLSAYRELIVEESIFTDNHLLSYQEIVNKLKQLRKSLPLFSHKVALSLPDNSVIAKQLHIDNGLSPQERDYAIIEAFSHQSPFELDELSLDYCQLAHENQSDSSRLIQVYATKRELVENRMQICRGAGFRPLLFELHSHSLVRLWQVASQQTKRANWLLLDVGHQRCLMVMDFANALPFSKVLPIGLVNTTEKPQGKLTNGNANNAAMKVFSADLAERIARHLPLLESMGLDHLAGIWLTGGGASLPILSLELSRRMQVKCQPLEPFKLIEMGRSSNKQADGKETLLESDRFSAALGLALLGCDWLEKEHA